MSRKRPEVFLVDDEQGPSLLVRWPEGRRRRRGNPPRELKNLLDYLPGPSVDTLQKRAGAKVEHPEVDLGNFPSEEEIRERIDRFLNRDTWKAIREDAYFFFALPLGNKNFDAYDFIAQWRFLLINLKKYDQSNLQDGVKRVRDFEAFAKAMLVNQSQIEVVLRAYAHTNERQISKKSGKSKRHR